MILRGDCVEVMKAIKPNSIDAIVHICPVCKKIFKKKVYKKAQAIYCSQKCAYKGRTLGYTKRRIDKPYNVTGLSIVRIRKNCVICKASFLVIPSKTKRKYCSRKCFEISHKERMQGKNNPSYINGNSYNKRSWRGLDWEELRRAVYVRDNWNCQECGIKCVGRKALNKNNSHKLIQCHHKIPYKISRDNSPGNLITHCTSCHGKIEATL